MHRQPPLHLAVLAAIVLTAGAPTSARAKVDPNASVATLDAKIVAKLKTLDTIAAADFEAGVAAMHAQHFEKAFADYQAVNARVPGFAPGLRRACEAATELPGRREEAITLCRKAADLSATPFNELALARALVTRPAPHQQPPLADLTEATTIVEQDLDNGGDQQIYGLLTAARVATAARDDGLLGRAVVGLERVAPNVQATAYYGIVDAVVQHDYDLARRRLAKLKALGAPPKLVAHVRAYIDHYEPFYVRWWKPVAIVAGAWLGGLLLLLLLGMVLSRVALAQARQPPAGLDEAVRGGERLLRRVYKAVLWISCAYYYASVPLMLVAEVALGGGLIYGFFVIGEIPVRLVFIIGFVVLVTVWGTIRALLVRVKTSDPGKRLDVSAHPRLEAVLTEVAERVGTPKVDAVFVVPGTEVAVFERGRLVDQIRGRSERCLILGAGVLDGLSVAELKSVLAHEYGHLVNEDTAGGGFALAVRRSLITLARSLARSGAARVYNPAWQFLRAFNRSFLRISQGASRLQEVLADRRAAIAYGSVRFAAGLRNVIEQSLRFDAEAGRVLDTAVKQHQALANLYAAARDVELPEDDLEKAIAKRLFAKPSPYDSHPAPADRIAWVTALAAPDRASPGDVEADAWSLFADPSAVQEGLTREIRERIQARHGIDLEPKPPGVPAPAG